MYHKNSINFSHIHCIGIGGIGMSALAIILKERGYIVSGSDGNLNQKSIAQLQKIGCIIHNDFENIPLADTVTLVVYSAAVAQHHHALVQAREKNIPIMKRSELLAELLNAQTGISVAGAHGKTTTSAIIAHIFMHAQQDPTFAIGGHLHTYQTNARAGQGKFFIAETCENDHTIELVRPHITILTNVDREHLDIYKDLDEIKVAFTNYLNNTKPGGTIIVCHDDANALSLMQCLSPTDHHDMLTYGFSEDADIFITDFELHTDHSTARVYQKTKLLPKAVGTFTLTIPGKHNLLNALAALSAAQKAGISFETFAQACASFQGIDRRFTFKGLYKGSEIFDDYGHHPAEIEQILKVALRRAESSGGQLIVLFQPHRYSRTEKLWSEFIDVFTQATFGTLIITDIYPAFEEPRPGISSKRLTEDLQSKNRTKTITYVPEDITFDGVRNALDAYLKPKDLIFFLGAGKINKLADTLTS